MTFKNVIILCIGVSTSIFSNEALSNNVQITNVAYEEGNNRVIFDLSWDNSWRFGQNFYDAVWLFVKYKPNNTSQWSHAKIVSSDIGSGLEEVSQSDQNGIFIRNSGTYDGHVPATSISLDLGTLSGPFPDIKVFGIEMVYIPEGSFYIGDGNSSGSYGIYSETEGDISGPYQITDSNLIQTGSSDGLLYSLGGTAAPVDIPSDYPNGYDAFYCMKYEINQEQYVDFLNCLSRDQQNNRTAVDISGTSVSLTYVLSSSATVSLSNRNGIRCPAILPNSGPVTFYNDLDGEVIEAGPVQGIVMPGAIQAYCTL